MSSSAASSTSLSNPDQSGRTSSGLFPSIPNQNIGSRTLSTPASSISSKSLCPSGFCGEIPTNPGGRYADATPGSTSSAAKTTITTPILRIIVGFKPPHRQSSAPGRSARPPPTADQTANPAALCDNPLLSGRGAAW